MESTLVAGLQGLFLGVLNLSIGHVIMLAIACLLLYLGIAKGYEPLLLVPIGFGAILVNIPLADMMGKEGFLKFFYDAGVLTEVFPLLIFVGIGAMTDFQPLLQNPKIILLGAAGQFAVIVFLVYFFLVTGDLYKRKIVKIAGPRLWQKKLTVQILDEINVQISSFIRVQIFTSFVVAVATAAALWYFGVRQYIVWGLLAGIFNSIPYLGPIIVSGGLAVVAFMQFNDIGKTVTICGVAFAITSLEGFLLTPTLMSRAARMNPVAIFVGLLFWSWVWGVWGAVLAVPMLMMLKAICDHLEDLQPIGELLGE